MGSKARIAKEILSIILKDRTDKQYYVEPFLGGMNSICEVSGNRIANDSNKYLISVWGAILSGYKPELITKEEYIKIRDNKDAYPDHVVGWVGFNCSFRGKFFGGFAGEVKCKTGKVRNYQVEAIKNTAKQAKKIEGVILQNKSYDELDIPKGSIIYCDPPYFGATGYKDKFDHIKFWNWVRKMKQIGHTIFVSEYNAPEDFKYMWSKELKSSLSTNGVGGGGNKISVEKLFTI